jgi:hypothetical protein
MRLATLSRISSGDQGTVGILTSEDFVCYILELPWRNNERAKSCIPEGVYQASWHKSPRFGWTYRISDVTGRSEILIHTGNYAGDTSRGFLSNSHGCLLPASRIGKMGGQLAGLLSRPAMNSLIGYFNKETFLLEIVNAYDSARTSI